jgi:hypothetical protein
VASHAAQRNTASPKYSVTELIVAKASGHICASPGLQHVMVEHDDWCAMYQGNPCNCHPDIHVAMHGGDEIIERCWQAASQGLTLRLRPLLLAVWR